MTQNERLKYFQQQRIIYVITSIFGAMLISLGLIGHGSYEPITLGILITTITIANILNLSKKIQTIKQANTPNRQLTRTVEAEDR